MPAEHKLWQVCTFHYQFECSETYFCLSPIPSQPTLTLNPHAHTHIHTTTCEKSPSVLLSSGG